MTKDLKQLQQLLRKGKREQAEALARELANEGSAEAFDILGSLALEQGKFPTAVKELSQAVALKPQGQTQHKLGIAYALQGKLKEALPCFEAAAEMEGSPQAWTDLGYTLFQLGDLSKAEDCLEKAIQVDSKFLFAYTNLALVKQKQEDWGAAEAALRQGMAVAPDHPEAVRNLGALLANQGRLKEAFELLEKAVKLAPDDPQSLSNLGSVLGMAGQLDAAEKVLRQAIVLAPHESRYYSNLAALLLRRRKIPESEAVIQKAMALDPNNDNAYINCAELKRLKGKIHEIVPVLEKALAINPNNAAARFDIGCSKLQKKQFKEGWEGYAYREQMNEFYSAIPNDRSSRRWKGENLNGKRLFVYWEQGLGDCIQFIRYLKTLHEQGAELLFLSHPALETLFLTQELPTRFVSTVEEADSLGYDYRTGLLAIPEHIGVDLKLMPDSAGYLKADPDKVKKYKAEHFNVDGFKLGIAWQGRPTHKRDAERSVALKRFAPLIQMDGICAYSLQKGQGEEAVETLPSAAITSLGPSFHDFTDTAAALVNLDLLITIDSVLAHLGGALGVPTWVILPKYPDWRWFLKGEDCPWYDSVRLFRQPSIGDWDSVFIDLQRALEELYGQWTKWTGMDPNGP